MNVQEQTNFTSSEDLELCTLRFVHQSDREVDDDLDIDDDSPFESLDELDVPEEVDDDFVGSMTI